MAWKIAGSCRVGRRAGHQEQHTRQEATGRLGRRARIYDKRTEEESCMTMAADTNATERLSRTVASWHDRAHALVVQDQASYEGAAVLLREIKSLRGEIELTFGPITAKARAAWKESLAQRKRHEAPLEIAEGTIKRAMATFIQV